MSLALLIPLSLAMGLSGLAAFLWALRNREFKGLDGAGWRVLMTGDEGEGGHGAPAAEAEQAERIEIADGRFVVGADLLAAAFGSRPRPPEP
ncbi:cbb3-type cytochrome oxidase assembly protein CcoS [Paracoccus versutus]|uniref:cbb3-type cytochrome oxidase assembly protein CcoS n=1 Tax=Paracoccus versutus TaxID=34007 RepID=UPI000DF7BC75|nr:cbb3-type cytochrome oxidase assembly protein CcoS [Paracoccus versutus]RDD69551.1 cbb3-type cytochrome oxidase assembly protein CcoS [Paracoccus versutus]